MRLWKTTAYFIKLIIHTVKDIKYFIYLVIIVIFAFANVFYMLNLNTTSNPAYRAEQEHSGEAEQPDFWYVLNYTGNSMVDPLISMYLLCLGNMGLEGQNYT